MDKPAKQLQRARSWFYLCTPSDFNFLPRFLFKPTNKDQLARQAFTCSSTLLCAVQSL